MNKDETTFTKLGANERGSTVQSRKCSYRCGTKLFDELCECILKKAQAKTPVDLVSKAINEGWI